METLDLVGRLVRNEITEFEVGWRDYQRLVWWLVSQETKLHAEPEYRSAVEHGEDAGVIDIVVRLTSSSVSFFGDEAFQKELTIFVECKQHNATLTLDKVGKVFCHSILEQPDALWIVSPRRLSAQAYAYAKRIFRTGDRVAPTAPLLRQTRFRHWRLRDLIDRRGPSDTLEFTDWQLLQLTAFGSTIVASANSRAFRRPPVLSDPNAAFRVHLVADGPLAQDSRLQVTLECDPPSDHPIILNNRPAGPEEVLADLPCTKIGDRTITGILVQDLDQHFERRIDIGRLSSQIFHSSVIELRPGKADEIVRRLVRSPNERLICLLGSAGSGKSTLLEQVAWKLVDEFGWDVRAHTISESTDHSLLYDLVEWFALALAPLDLIDVKNSEIDVRRSIVSTLAYQHSGLQTPDVVQNLIDAAARGTLNEALIQQLVRMLGRIALARETPLLVVLRDMHAASPSVMNVLNRLILRLRDQGWGNVRFIVEARTDSQSDISGADPLSQLAERLGDDFAVVKIDPLSIEELHAVIYPRFQASDLTEAVQFVHRATGGYPLLVNHLFHDLLARAIVTKPRAGHDFHSIDLNALKGFLPPLAPVQFDSILRRRLAAATSSNSEIMTACLGIVARVLRVMPDGVPHELAIDLVASGLGVNEEQVNECIYRATSLGIFHPENGGRAIAFAHEAIRTMAIEYSRSNAGLIHLIGSSLLNRPGAFDVLGPFRSSLVRGLLAGEVGRLEHAISLILLAESNAAETGNLVQRRLALECALDLLSRNARPDNNWTRNELAVRERLVWTTMQQSSQRFVQETIERCDDRLNLLYETGLVSKSEHGAAAFHYSRCRVVIATRGLDAIALLEALPVMIENALDASQLHYALTRIVLVAIEIDDVPSARRAIEYCLRLPALGQDPDVHLSFLSELGDMFTVDQPQTALIVRQVAADLADRLVQARQTDIRSRAHAHVNLFSAQARAGLFEVDETEFRSLDEQWSEQGFLNPLLRLKNLRGYVAASGLSEGADRALGIWQSCLDLADATGHASIAWQAAHNLSMLERVRGNGPASHAFAVRTKAILAPFRSHRNSLHKLISGLLDAVSRSGELSTDLATDILPIPFEALQNVSRISLMARYMTRKNVTGSPYVF